MNDINREYDAEGNYTDIEISDEEQAARDAVKNAIIAEQSVNSIKLQIAALEETQTLRRIREAFSDPEWLNNLNQQIAALRAQL